MAKPIGQNHDQSPAIPRSKKRWRSSSSSSSIVMTFSASKALLLLAVVAVVGLTHAAAQSSSGNNVLPLGEEGPSSSLESSFLQTKPPQSAFSIDAIVAAQQGKEWPTSITRRAVASNVRYGKKGEQKPPQQQHMNVRRGRRHLDSNSGARGKIIQRGVNRALKKQRHHAIKNRNQHEGTTDPKPVSEAVGGPKGGFTYVMDDNSTMAVAGHADKAAKEKATKEKESKVNYVAKGKSKSKSKGTGAANKGYLSTNYEYEYEYEPTEVPYVEGYSKSKSKSSKGKGGSKSQKGYKGSTKSKGAGGGVRYYEASVLLEMKDHHAATALTPAELQQMEYLVQETYNGLSQYNCDLQGREFVAVTADPTPTSTGYIVHLQGECYDCDPAHVRVFAHPDDSLVFYEDDFDVDVLPKKSKKSKDNKSKDKEMMPGFDDEPLIGGGSNGTTMPPATPGSTPGSIPGSNPGNMSSVTGAQPPLPPAAGGGNMSSATTTPVASTTATPGTATAATTTPAAAGATTAPMTANATTLPGNQTVPAGANNTPRVAPDYERGGARGSGNYLPKKKPTASAKRSRLQRPQDLEENDGEGEFDHDYWESKFQYGTTEEMREEYNEGSSTRRKLNNHHQQQRRHHQQNQHSVNQDVQQRTQHDQAAEHLETVAINRPPDALAHPEEEDRSDDYTYPEEAMGVVDTDPGRHPKTAKMKGYNKLHDGTSSKGSKSKKTGAVKGVKGSSGYHPMEGCQNHNATRRAPSEEEFVMAFNLASAMGIATVDSLSVRSAVQVQTEPCAAAEEVLESALVAQFMSPDPSGQFLTPEEVPLAEMFILQTYNHLQASTTCDVPYFREMTELQLQGVAPGPTANTFLAMFSLQGTCRGEGCSTGEGATFFDPIVERKKNRHLEESYSGVGFDSLLAPPSGHSGSYDEASVHVYQEQCYCPFKIEEFGPPPLAEMEEIVTRTIQDAYDAGLIKNMVTVVDMMEVASPGTGASTGPGTTGDIEYDENIPTSNVAGRDNIESFVIVQFFGARDLVTEPEVVALQESMLQVYRNLQEGSFCDPEMRFLSMATLQTVDPGPTPDSFLLGFLMEGLSLIHI